MDNKQITVSTEQQTYQRILIQKYTNDVVALYRTTIKIRDVDESNRDIWTKVRESLNCAVVLVGIPNFMNDSEYRIMKDFLIAEYKDYSPDEITIAFHKLSAGKLDISEEQGKHYGKMSAAFLGNVLKSYRNYRNTKLAEKIKEEDLLQLIPEKTEEEKLEIRKFWIDQNILKPFAVFKDAGHFVFDDNDLLLIFRMLWKREKITISKDQAIDYKEKAKTYLVQEAINEHTKRSRHYKELVEKLGLIDTAPDKTIDNRLKIRASKLYIKDYLKLIANERDIKGWLEKVGMYEIIEGE